MQASIRDLHARKPDDPTFEQVGLLDGLEIVTHYLDVGELGCAVSHLLYMVHEADVVVPRPTVLDLHALAERIGEPNHYRAGSESRRTAAQHAAIFNEP